MKIREIWGKVIRVDINSEDYSVARVLINTSVFPLINKWICFSLDETVFDVHVRETIDLPCDQGTDDKQSILEKNKVKSLSTNALEGGGNRRGDDDKEDESSHERKKKNIEDEQKHLMQSILHNGQNVDTIPCLGNCFAWDVELMDHYCLVTYQFWAHGFKQPKYCGPQGISSLFES